MRAMRFLAEFVEALEGTRTLYLGNFRPEYSAAWMRKWSYQQIALNPLTPSEIDLLMGDLIGTDPSTKRLTPSIRERTGGNPFFIEETIQELIETGKLQGIKGAFRLTGAVVTLDLPSSVQSVLAARIDRLTEDEKRTIQTAAVIGRTFPERVLLEVSSAEVNGLAECLSGLRDKEFVDEERLFPEVQYTFKHPLTHEVALQSQLASRRRAVHASVALAIEKLYPDKLGENAALLATHWEAAGDGLQAARWNKRAAEWAGVSATAEAGRHWRKVLELLDNLPENEETTTLGLAARGQILGFGWRIGLTAEESERLFEDACILAERSGDEQELAFLHWAMGGVVAVNRGDVGRYLELSARAVRLADETRDLGLRRQCAVGGTTPCTSLGW